MISGYRAIPVFQYKFRPLANDSRALDGGFCITLYDSAILCCTVFNLNGSRKDEWCFRLPSRSLQCYYALLRNAVSWLPSTPEDIRGENAGPYASLFAFDGYDPFRVWGIDTLLSEPCGSAGGFFARHLFVLFEDICNIFAESGVTLALDGFSWSPERIQPFQRTQPQFTGVQGAI